MIKKKIIAVDVDDVLSESLEALRQAVNRRAGTNLRPEDYRIEADYWGYFLKVWEKHGVGDRVSMDDFNTEEDHSRFKMQPHEDAMQVLGALSRRYELAVVTSRHPQLEPVTKLWLERYFPGLFSIVAFTGAPDDPGRKEKGELCLEIGAEWLIDDSVEHCESANTNGITAILFGDYGWHHKAPKHLVRAKDWPAVQRYFDGVAGE